MRVAHNLTIATTHNPQLDRYVNNLAIVVSDVDDESQKIEKSEQIAVMFQPQMEPEVFVQAIRSFADAVEKYLTVGNAQETDEVNTSEG